MTIKSKSTSRCGDVFRFGRLHCDDKSTARMKTERFIEVNEELHNQYGGQIMNFLGNGTVSIFSKNIAPILNDNQQKPEIAANHRKLCDALLGGYDDPHFV